MKSSAIGKLEIENLSDTWQDLVSTTVFFSILYEHQDVVVEV